jgi:hypothetical protein
MDGKKLLFFILMPIYLPISLLFNATFDWWVDLPNNGNRLLFVILLPIYAPIALILNSPFLGFDWWVGLAG